MREAPLRMITRFFSIDDCAVIFKRASSDIQLWQLFCIGNSSNNFTLRLRRIVKVVEKKGEISFARCAHFNSNFHLEFIIADNAIATVARWIFIYSCKIQINIFNESNYTDKNHAPLLGYGNALYSACKEKREDLNFSQTYLYLFHYL